MNERGRHGKTDRHKNKKDGQAHRQKKRKTLRKRQTHRQKKTDRHTEKKDKH